MPAKSLKQVKAARIALAAKHGKIPVGALKGAAKTMYKSMTESELKEFTIYNKKSKRRHNKRGAHK